MSCIRTYWRMSSDRENRIFGTEGVNLAYTLHLRCPGPVAVGSDIDLPMFWFETRKRIPCSHSQCPATRAPWIGGAQRPLGVRLRVCQVQSHCLRANTEIITQGTTQQPKLSMRMWVPVYLLPHWQLIFASRRKNKAFGIGMPSTERPAIPERANIWVYTVPVSVPTYI